MVAYSFQKRFVVPIRIGLGLPVPPTAAGVQPKRQTIRAIGKRRHARADETLQLYTGMRTRQCELIATATCRAVERIVMWLTPADIAVMIAGKTLGSRQMADFARADGFDDVADMLQFWRDNHPGVDKFEGVLIQWGTKE